MKNQIKQILREGLILEQRIKFNIDIPQDILQIKDIFKKNDFKLYVVGGAVRDALLNQIPKDFDLATDAVPDKVEEIMAKAGLRTLPTGKSFGVINVFTDQGEYEVATFRRDGVSSDSRRPDSVEFTDIQGDVSRRDLTINALFYDIDTGEVVDLVGGVEDIKNGVVRTVGNPEDRFKEDKLRVMRAIRFAGRFGSELDPATDAALKRDASLGGISGERIRDEFIKGLNSSKTTKHFLEMLEKYGLFKFIFQGLNVDLSILKSLGNYKQDDYIVLIARLLHKNDMGTLKKVLNERKYSQDEVKAITFLVALEQLDVDTAVALKRAQEHAGVSQDQIRNFGANQGISSQLLDAFEEFRLSVSGPEAMEKTGLKPGKELGQAIQQMETNNFKKLL